MKNRFLLTLLITILLFSLSSVCVFAQETYKIGILVNDSQQDQQLKVMLGDMLEFLSNSDKDNIEPVWFSESAAFLEAAKKNELDFAYTKEYDPFIVLVKEYNYTPLVTATFFGKKKLRCCMYASKESGIKGAGDIKGLRMMTYRTQDGYYPLRQLLGDTKPEEFFSELMASDAGAASLGALLEGKTDLAWVYEGNLEAMKLGNPAILKKITELMCSDAEYNAALSYRKGVSPEFVEKVRNIMLNAHSSDALQKYKPLIAKTKLRFAPVTAADFKGVFDMYEKAAKNGWVKDHEKWLKSLKQ